MMKRALRISLFFVAALLYLGACQQVQQEQASEEPAAETNPAAEGFDLEGSDPHAIAIADSVMLAMGGRESWDTTQYFTWNFFGFRRLWWDKFSGDVRVDYLIEGTTCLVNIHTREGQAVKNGEPITEPDSLNKYLDNAYKAWINDAYWLFMPFKLKDSGVTLTHVGTDSVYDEGLADILEVKFKNVGVTPDNKYWVYVDQDTRLVNQWSYFKDASQEEPNLTTAWRDYTRHGDLLLSGNRVVRQITDIHVFHQLPRAIFTSTQPIALEDILQTYQ